MKNTYRMVRRVNRPSSGDKVPERFILNNCLQVKKESKLLKTSHKEDKMLKNWQKKKKGARVKKTIQFADMKITIIKSGIEADNTSPIRSARVSALPVSQSMNRIVQTGFDHSQSPHWIQKNISDQYHQISKTKQNPCRRHKFLEDLSKPKRTQINKKKRKPCTGLVMSFWAKVEEQQQRKKTKSRGRRQETCVENISREETEETQETKSRES